MKIYDLDTIFDFGKHKGKTLKQVLEFTGDETFDFPELKNKPKPKPKKRGDKLVLSTPEEIKRFQQGITMNTSPNGIQYINWCIINRDDFFIHPDTIFKIKKDNPNFYLKNEAKEINEEKLNEWIEQIEWNQRQADDFELNAFLTKMNNIVVPVWNLLVCLVTLKVQVQLMVGEIKT